MLIAEDLLLLLTDDDSGKLIVSRAQIDVVLGGALLVELALGGNIDAAGPGEDVREGRLVVRNADPTGDPILDEALAAVSRKQGKRPQTIVTVLGKGKRAALYERLAGAGVVRAEEGAILGIFPTHRWPTADAAREVELRAALATALRVGRAGDDRTGSLISLLHAVKVVHKVVDPGSVGLSKRALNANAKAISDGDWAAKAVRSAIDSMNTAIIAAGAAAGAAGASSGS